MSTVQSHWSLGALQELIASGEISSETLVKTSLSAISDGADINAFITLRESGAIEDAIARDSQRSRGEKLGPLHGVPVAVKDNIQVAKLPTTGGTPALRGCISQRDAGVVSRLKAAGAIVIGKTNMHELAFGITSDNVAFGAVHNGRRHHYIAGGSSGGTAAAIASGMVVAGLGTDTGGSCRIPAALNGIVGFRPTTGRYPADGLIRISHTRDTVGPMARTVADVALLDAILAEETLLVEAVSLKNVRLGIPKDHFYLDLDPAVAASMADTLVRLKAAGATLIDVDLRQIGPLNERIGFPLVLYESQQLLVDYLAENCPETRLEELVADIASPDVKEAMSAVVRGAVSDDAYAKAVCMHRPLLQAMYHDCFAQNRLDALIFPTTPLTARPILDSRDFVDLNGRRVATFSTYIRNTDPGSNAGIPGVSLPAPIAEGLMPIGIELDGPAHGDRQLLAVAIAIERLLREGKSGGSND